MTVSELISKLSTCPPNAELTVRHGWEVGPAHYSLDLVHGGTDEPVLVITWRTDNPMADAVDDQPSWVKSIQP